MGGLGPAGVLLLGYVTPLDPRVLYGAVRLYLSFL